MSISFRWPITILVLAMTSNIGASTAADSLVDLSLASFDAASMNGNFKLLLIQGDEERIVVEGSRKQLNQLEILDKNGKVVVKPRHQKQLKGRGKVHISLYFKQLREIELNGIGLIQCQEPLKAPELEINCNGIKTVEIDLEVGQLNATFSGVGRTTLRGHAHRAFLEYSGIGNLEAIDLKTRSMKVESSGIGRVEVWATEELEVNASGIGSVWYAGEPAIKRFEGSGMGKIKAI